jgi:hypothetical protein
LLMAQYIYHESMNRKRGHKELKLKHQPTKEVIYKMTKLDHSNLYKITKDLNGDYTVHNVAKNATIQSMLSIAP